MPLKSFSEDAYAQDPIVPTRVEHRVEYGNWLEKSQFHGHWYDFLIYEFLDGENRAEAVRYMDEERVVLRILEPHTPTSDFAIDVLAFLSLRYTEVEISGASDESNIMDDQILEKIEQRKRKLFEEHKD